MKIKLGKERNANKIVETFKRCTPNDTVNWQREDGSVYETGGILYKLDKDGNQFFAINGKWVPAFG